MLGVEHQLWHKQCQAIASSGILAPSVAVQASTAGSPAAAQAAVQTSEAVSAGHSTSSSAAPTDAAVPVSLQCIQLTDDATDAPAAAATLFTVWKSLTAPCIPDTEATTASTTVRAVEVQQAQHPTDSKAGGQNNGTISMPVSLVGTAYGSTSVPIPAGLKAAGLRAG